MEISQFHRQACRGRSNLDPIVNGSVRHISPAYLPHLLSHRLKGNNVSCMSGKGSMCLRCSNMDTKRHAEKRLCFCRLYSIMEDSPYVSLS